jgi:BASS family bile acid:Na+ symporter
MALTLAVGLAAGHLLGGPRPQDRAALAVTAATRHPGIALMIANVNNLDKAVVGAILGMLVMGLVVSTPYQIWVKRRRSAAERSAAAAHDGPRG